MWHKPIANSAIERKESRGAHQRLDYTERDDVELFKTHPCLLQWQ